jgi:predicted RNA-binding Zn-ribbon protein involved in translation (DUF1610 family)
MMSGNSGDEPETNQPQSDEVYCTSCGESIKKEAEVCPECGVRQLESEEDQESSNSKLPEGRKYELQKLARKDKTTVAIVSFLLTPVGYLMVGKTGLAVINFLTFNYLLFGIIIVPFHTMSIIDDAREELERYGETW